jgi:hypothetical protein
MAAMLNKSVAVVLIGFLSLPVEFALSQPPSVPLGSHPVLSSALPTASSTPAIMFQCEGDQCTSPRGGGGAVWVFKGSRGQAMWKYGAIANLTIERYDGHTIVIHREDPNPSYSSPRFADPAKRSDGVFFADYVGVVHGSRVDGTVSWNGGGKGTWYATIPQALCDPFSTCPLNADQLVQLGKNSLNNKLNRPALLCFWAAGVQGNSDGKAFAGIMIRDGAGTPANPARGLTILKESANENNYSGELALAQSYELGVGVPKSSVQADYWKTRAAKRAQEIQQQAAQQKQQQQQQQMGEVVLGVLVIGAIAALLSSDSGADDTGASSSTNSSGSNSNVYRDQELSRRAEWYSHGGSFGGPDPLWQKGDPVPK